MLETTHIKKIKQNETLIPCAADVFSWNPLTTIRPSIIGYTIFIFSIYEIKTSVSVMSEKIQYINFIHQLQSIII